MQNLPSLSGLLIIGAALTGCFSDGAKSKSATTTEPATTTAPTTATTATLPPTTIETTPANLEGNGVRGTRAETTQIVSTIVIPGSTPLINKDTAGTTTGTATTAPQTTPEEKPAIATTTTSSTTTTETKKDEDGDEDSDDEGIHIGLIQLETEDTPPPTLDESVLESN